MEIGEINIAHQKYHSRTLNLHTWQNIESQDLVKHSTPRICLGETYDEKIIFSGNWTSCAYLTHVSKTYPWHGRRALFRPGVIHDNFWKLDFVQIFQFSNLEHLGSPRDEIMHTAHARHMFLMKQIKYLHIIRFQKIIMISKISRLMFCQAGIFEYYVSPSLEIQCFAKCAKLMCEKDFFDLRYRFFRFPLKL